MTPPLIRGGASSSTTRQVFVRRLVLETDQRLEKAAAKSDLSKSEYAESAIVEKMAKENRGD